MIVHCSILFMLAVGRLDFAFIEDPSFVWKYNLVHYLNWFFGNIHLGFDVSSMFSGTVGAGNLWNKYKW